MSVSPRDTVRFDDGVTHAMMPLFALSLACTGPTTTDAPTDDKDVFEVPTGDTSTDTPVPTIDTGWEPLDCSSPPKDGPLFYEVQHELNQLHPTVAYARWCQREAAPVTVEVSFDKGEWQAAPVVDAVEGANTRVVVGIPYGHTAQWRLVSGKVTYDVPVAIEVPAAPEGMPIPEVLKGTDSWAPEHRYLLTSISEDGGSWGSQGPYHTVIYDRQGRPVWTDASRRGKRTLYAQVSVTGRTLLFDRFSGAAGSPDAIAIRSHLDEEVERIPIEDHHHAFIELQDGTIVWGRRGFGTPEQIVERPPGSSTVRVVWDCAKDWPEAGFCASNSLYYDPANDRYGFSHYITETIVVIDRTTGETQWWAGRDVAGGYTFDPPSSQYWWQHGVFFTEEGNLLVSTHNMANGPTTNLIREYEVDDTARTLRLVFEYDSGVLAQFNGDIRKMANGNYLLSLGTGAVVHEVDEKGQLVWGLDFNNDGVTNRLLGKSEYVADLYQLTSTWEPPAPETRN